MFSVYVRISSKKPDGGNNVLKILKSIKPKRILPNKVILHDAVITECTLKKDFFKLIFSGGFQLITENGNAEVWAKSGSVTFEKIDPDFCSFSVIGRKKHREYEISEFLELLKHKKTKQFEIVDEYYGFSSIMLCGYFWHKHKHKKFQIKLYYKGDMVYESEFPA